MLKSVSRHLVLSLLSFLSTVIDLRPSLSPHIVGIIQQPGQAQYPHKRREILGRNLVKGNLHLVAKLVDYPFLIAAQLHGTVKFFLDLCKSRLWIGGSAVGNMGLTNVLDDAVQIIMDRVAEKVALLHLSKLQRADIKVVLTRRMAADHFLPGGLQHQIHLGNPHISDPIYINLRIQHHFLKIMVTDNFRQQPGVEFPGFQNINRIITQVQGTQLCV